MNRQIRTIKKIVALSQIIKNDCNFQHRFIYTDKTSIKYREGILPRIVKKYNLFNYSSSRMKASGYLLYETIADKVPYADFFNRFHLADTFYSWFLITELHVWMLCARVMSEDDDGKFVRNAIIEAMWSDIQERTKQLVTVSQSSSRQYLAELSEQFQAAIISYDEGLLSKDDKVLASAIWRRVFQKNCDNAKHIEELVKYVRQHMQLLDEISAEELINKRSVKWLSLNNKTL